LRKGKRFGKYKRNSSRVQEEDKYRSKKIGKIRYSRRKRLQKGEITREIYGKDFV